MSADVIVLRTGTHHALPDGYVNGVQLAHQAGVTYRQVDYWTRARELLDTGTTHIAGMPVHLPQDL